MDRSRSQKSLEPRSRRSSLTYSRPGNRRPHPHRYRALQAFFGWCVREGELDRSPMETMPPSAPESPVPILTDAQLKALL
jgi:hypothetical protein